MSSGKNQRCGQLLVQGPVQELKVVKAIMPLHYPIVLRHEVAWTRSLRLAISGVRHQSMNREVQLHQEEVQLEAASQKTTPLSLQCKMFSTNGPAVPWVIPELLLHNRLGAVVQWRKLVAVVQEGEARPLKKVELQRQ